MASTTIAAAPRKIAAAVSASGALVKGKHNPVDASTATRAMTLPASANEGAVLSVEKIDSSSNTVTVTGSIRGTANSALALLWQYESLELVADAAGSWWPTAGHKTKAALDFAYVGRPSGGTDGQVLAKSGSGFAFTSLSSGKGDTFLGMAATLKMGVESTGIIANGDSTTTDDTGWFRLLANAIAGQYPNYTSRYWKWNDTTQKYDRPVVLNDAGTKRAVAMASSGTRAGRSAAGANITSTIEVIANLKSPAYNGDYFIASKWTNDTQVSWGWRLRTGGYMEFLVSADGSTTTTAIPSTAHGLADGVATWLKVQHTPNDGSGNRVTKFFKSNDAVIWTQIGSTVTTSGALVPFVGTSDYTVGCRSASTGAFPALTEFYELWINDGIDGAPVVPPLVHTWGNTIGANATATTGAPEINFVLAAQPGAGIGYERALTGYLTDPVRMPKLTIDLGQQIAFFSSSHNDYNLHVREHQQKYMAWVNAVTARMPQVRRIALTQNPRFDYNGGTMASDYTGVGHKARRGNLISFAGSNSIDVIDTYQAFLDDGRPLYDATATHLINDGVHPTGAGYAVWFNRVYSDFTAALTRVAG